MLPMDSSLADCLFFPVEKMIKVLDFIYSKYETQVYIYILCVSVLDIGSWKAANVLIEALKEIKIEDLPEKLILCTYV